MPYKTKEDRKKNYDKKKDEINKKRREYGKRPEVSRRKRQVEKRWREKNLDKVKIWNKKFKKIYVKKIKDKVFDNYGRTCVCCGEDIKEFLTIDHIDGNGTKHRKKINNNLYIWLVKNNFPKGFQTLCFNCNWGKHINGGICPHQEKKNSKD